MGLVETKRHRIAVRVSDGKVGDSLALARIELTVPTAVTSPVIALADLDSLPRATPDGPAASRPRAPPAC